MSLKEYEYYSNPLVTIYYGDCLNILPHIPQVDLVLTDPPYGIGEDGSTNHTRGGLTKSTNFTEGLGWDEKRIEYINDVVNIGKHAIVWGGNYYADILGASSCWLVWDKDNGKTDFADCELAWTNFDTAVRKFKWKWQGMLQEDMKNKEKHYHPTQKPIPLFTWILENYSAESDVILDAFMGSGTTLISCMKLHRKGIGIDNEEYWCEMSAKRCEQARTGLTPAEQEAEQGLLFD